MSTQPQPLGPRREGSNAPPSGLLDNSLDLCKRAPAWRLLVGSTLALFVTSIATAVMPLRHETPTLSSSIAAARPEQAPAVAQGAEATRSQSPGAPASETQTTPAPNETVCSYKGGSGGSGQGRVVGFLSREQAATLLARSQEATGARINPNYLGNPRVIITMPNGSRLVVISPSGMAVKPGDQVAFAGYHRDSSMACGYIPNLITDLLQPR